MAAAVSLPNTLTNGQPNDASQVMADLNALVTWINTNAVHLDGAKAMTGALSGPAGVDPSSADQYARKAYVDAGNTAEAALRVTGDARMGAKASRVANQSMASITPTLVSFDTETFDTSTFFAPTSTNVTVPASSAGLYVVTAIVTTPNPGAAGSMDLFLNGAIFASGAEGGNVAANASYWTLTTLMVLAVSDILTIKFQNNSGGAYNVTGSLTVARLAP